MNRELLFEEDLSIADSAADFAFTFRNEMGVPFGTWKRNANQLRNKETGVLTYSLNGVEVDLEDGIYKCYELKKEENA